MKGIVETQTPSMILMENIVFIIVGMRELKFVLRSSTRARYKKEEYRLGYSG